MVTARIARLGRRFLIGCGSVLLGLWLVEISGVLELRSVARVVAALASAAIPVTLAASLVALWRAPRGARRNRSLALAGLLLVAFVVRFTGLDFELLDRPIGDEGVFHEVAQEINRGQAIPKLFNYGHFLYYAGAFAIWFYDLFPRAVTGLLELFYTTVEGYGVQRLLLNGVNALLSTLAAGAVFGAAYRIVAPGNSGSDDAEGHQRALVSGTLASVLIVFSPLYNSVAHELIADVPAAAFAAIALYFVSRLLERESLRDYLLAGAASGLAAASKYPGGVVAVAIFGVWLSWRVRRRRWSWDLLWSALASIGAMVAVMPGLVIHAEKAFLGGGYDVFFGFRQYARGGWLGVQPDSNLAWYGAALVSSFGWPALGLGVLGAPLQRRPELRRWLIMAVFPAVYFALILSMTMVVGRNLQVLMPALAVLIGPASAAILFRLRKRRALAIAVAAGALALPVWKTTAWTISQTRPGTRQLAKAWIEENVPEGASLIRERYSPEPDEALFTVSSHRFAAWVEPEELYSGDWDYLVLARPAYGRFLDPDQLRREHQEEFRARYLEMLELPKVVEFAPTALTAGPLLSVHRIEPEAPAYLDERIFLPDDATFISHKDLRRDGPGKWLQYTLRWQFAVFKDYFSAGLYKVEFGTNPPPREGYLHVIDRSNREVGTYDLLKPVEVELPADEKYLFRVFIAPPTRLYGVKVSKVEPAG